jgi:hypothetical protein
MISLAEVNNPGKSTLKGLNKIEQIIETHKKKKPSNSSGIKPAIWCSNL